MGRIFCSEKCIVGYFEPEIQRLEQEYFKHLSREDIDVSAREKYSHLRWKTLAEPNEVWVERTLSGDSRYTLIAEFTPGSEKLWSVCISLLLRGEPSFLYLSFVTRDPNMVEHFRKGEKANWEEVRKRTQTKFEPFLQEDEAMIDGLAEPWTKDETFRAQMNSERNESDIPANEFLFYQACLEETLESPDEVWINDHEGLEGPKGESRQTYHFIKHYAEGTGYWYILIARETDEDDQLEVLDAFPTRDPDLVDKFRVGSQEVGDQETVQSSRMVH